MKFGDILDLAKQTFKEWGEDKASRLGASLAYYTIFSIGPLLLITIAIASFVFSNAKDQIVGTISGVVGSAGGEVITQTIDNANKGGANIIATTIGIITLLLGASGVFGQLKDALNTIWEVETQARTGHTGNHQTALLLVQHGPGHGLPLTRVTGHKRSRSCSQHIFERYLAGWANNRPDSQYSTDIPGYHRYVCSLVQVPSGR